MSKELKQLYVIRHGETDYNRQRIVQGSGIDSDLNDKGLDQASKFCIYYNHIPFDLILCSTLKRSFQTIKNFNDSIPIIQLSDLNEISWGVQEGNHSTPETIAQYKYVVNQWSMGNIDERLPEGESARELLTRMERIKYLLQTLDFKSILICTHGRAMRALMCGLLEKEASYMEQCSHSNTGLYKLDLINDKFNLIDQNNTDHLVN